MSRQDDLTRMVRIASRAAKSCGASAGVYANATSFDVMLEKYKLSVNKDGGLQSDFVGHGWVKLKTRDVYAAPRATALRLRAEIKRLWK